ncbi:TRAP transporter substrate-binding protein DctP [Phaeobacter gallaeciensis]|jgi:TRAP-type C4-dicarboxylate transport system substrate-binding protein|uniref:TRAP transporter substrate-binding protein DctP n=1 Tax=Phaeobacter gallaeciensis TaxID=60890 RepID=UPI00237F20E1|nr:TRAP transporter substrate-binding protein DctP [Phaeobacter gallaeciensis]MDE4098598.1 TRAP transporter substrate-binding protein DctP [Phaeobacter gallaeciensis]MDE4107408.1 TRAP transporter substrate-binding protein DctP [Phaeobacter gallaeciensis]MDE4111640.1 TRAP transporter substrate-binding protein DctP [Phaeobacter gallaeciensis]MDE4116333.1 TRAP transporter substrate-binding protein DctP [Phaeobacter gallaeciensis]MDE4120804.1 TRAP transporter substrate-binding protein DctP [Phaeob
MTFRSSAATIALVAATALGTSAAQAEEVSLRAVTAFATGTTFSRDFEAFVDWVNENGKGVVQIELLGGPEAVPPFELGNAVQAGIVDIANNTTAYYPNLVPTGDALHLAQNTIQEQRENGCYELVDSIHQDQMNVKYLARVGDHMNYHLYLTKPLEGPDLTGLTLRTTPVYRAMFEKLGATLVRTAPGEVYTALERGAIDGYGWPSQGVLDLGWHEQTAYRVDPGFYQVDVNFLVNLDAWNGLDDEQRALLEKGAAWIEEQNAMNVERNAAEAKAQADAGIKTLTFEGEAAATWNTTAQEEGWGEVMKIDADLGAKLQACLLK